MGHKELAKKNYKKFHKRSTEKETNVSFVMPRALTYLGAGNAIEYVSDKILPGKKRTGRLYRHKFGSGVKIYLHPNRDWILIHGGNFRVTDWMRG